MAEAIRECNFRGSNHPLSNLFPCTIYEYEHYFTSVEQAYQYRKAIWHERYDLAKQIRKAKSGMEAMCLGTKICPDEGWHEIKIRIMFRLLLCKSRSCIEYYNFLMNTLDVKYRECTLHPFWGAIRGHNVLGMLHEQVRRYVLSEQEKANKFINQCVTEMFIENPCIRMSQNLTK